MIRLFAATAAAIAVAGFVAISSQPAAACTWRDMGPAEANRFAGSGRFDGGCVVHGCFGAGSVPDRVAFACDNTSGSY